MYHSHLFLKHKHKTTRETREKIPSVASQPLLYENSVWNLLLNRAGENNGGQRQLSSLNNSQS